MKKAAVFEDIYQQYLTEVSAVDLDRVAGILGIGRDEDAAVIPFYGINYRVSGRGITDGHGRRPSHAVSVILCKYLLLCPETAPAAETEWIKYNNFKDAAPFAGGFFNMAERPIAAAFSGRLPDMEKAVRAMGGGPCESPVSCDLAVRLPALPRVLLLMLFNDRDEEFPADCSLLFEKRADAYLDMECLAMLGMVLAVWLKGTPGDPDSGL